MSELHGKSKASKLWIRSHLRASEAVVEPTIECFEGRCTTQDMLQPLDLAGTKRDAFSNTRHAEVDTDDASCARANLHRSSTNPSTVAQKFWLRSHTRVSGRSASVSLDTRYLDEYVMCDIIHTNAGSSVGSQQLL